MACYVPPEAWAEIWTEDSLQSMESLSLVDRQEGYGSFSNIQA